MESGRCRFQSAGRRLCAGDGQDHGRHIFDQDNKGWKAVSNAIKGRIIPDDDQYTLSVALLSTRSRQNVCHITVLDMKDAPNFFSARAGDYSVTGLY